MTKVKSSRTRSKSKLEREYRQIFLTRQLPYQGIYTEEDTLEQPSALKYVPSTTTPNAEA